MNNFEINYATPFSIVCRTCLRVKANMRPLYDEYIAKMLMYCASIQILHNDGMPSLICQQCLRQVNRSYSFKQLCEKSDSTLKQYIVDGFLPPEETIQSLIGNEVEISDAHCTDNFIHSELRLNHYTEEDPLLLATQQFANLSQQPSEDDDTSGFADCLELGLEPECNLVENALAALQEDLNRGDNECIRPTLDIICQTQEVNQSNNSTQDLPVPVDPDIPKDIPDINTCHVCRKTFELVSDLDIHKTIHTTDGNIQCSVCSKKFNQMRSLKRHLKTHMSRKGHTCNLCSKEFSDSSSLTKHKKRHSNLLKVHTCKTCGKSYDDSTQLSTHIRTHTGEKPFACTSCDKTFHDKRSLVSHTRTHTQDRYFQCTVCAKRFVHCSSLTTHLRIHTGEKPYKCHLCDKRFAQSANLSHHMQTHTKVKPYTCTVCNKSFATSSNLMYHKTVHTGVKAYQCNVCGKTLSRLADVKTHMRIHTGERPFPCSICPKKFITSSNRKEHMAFHARNKAKENKTNPEMKLNDVNTNTQEPETNNTLTLKESMMP